MMKYTFSIPEDTKQIIELEFGMKVDEYLEKVKDNILDKQENGEKLTVNKAAQLMNVTPQFIRIGIQTGKLPFGWAVNISGKGRYTYYISPKKFTEHTGIKVPEQQFNQFNFTPQKHRTKTVPLHFELLLKSLNYVQNHFEKWHEMWLFGMIETSEKPL